MLNYLRKSKYILGINERNLRYTRTASSLVEKDRNITDDKLKTKKLLKKNNIPTTETYRVIKSHKSLKNIKWNKLPSTFVIKANHGTFGKGVLIVFGKKEKGNIRKKRNWILADGKPLTKKSVENHISKTLEGNFSLGRFSDTAFIEERLKVHPDLKPHCKRGVPDIRIVSYNKIPVMAELRLPTAESEGRANLHQGGVGLGIDMGTGITTSHGIWHNKSISHFPGKGGLPFAGIKIPQWKKVLELAVKTQIALDIKYLGLDIAVDRDRGPVIIEVNATPMLGIQIANLAPLKERLERVEGIKIKSVKHAVRLAQNLFGGDIEEEVEEVSGRKVIGATQPIEIIDKKENKHSFVAKIDTGILKTKIRKDIAEKLKLRLNKKEEKPTVFLSFIMDNIIIDTEALLADDSEKSEIIIGRRDLKKFLIDPTKIYLKSKKVVRKKA